MKPFQEFIDSLDNQTLDRVIGGIMADIQKDCHDCEMSEEDAREVKANIYPVRVTLGLLELYHRWLGEEDQ